MTPFFNPGPIEHPEIPVYMAGVNTRLATLASGLCDGFHVHPFRSPEYARKTVKPAIAEGAKKEGRNLEEVQLATSVFVVFGEKVVEIEEQREKVRAQIAFYASTPPTVPSSRPTAGRKLVRSWGSSPGTRSGKR
jgi:alkanesulfonate monooxygenase SsuD/methylene tetrahydromethanopterin reductase-like flavin-dependent oxidoreductase (luciferase family)